MGLGCVGQWALSAQIKVEASAWLSLLTPSDLGLTIRSPAMGSTIYPVTGSGTAAGGLCPCDLSSNPVLPP